MSNYYNYQYYAPLYIGNNQQNMTFIWDTGSTMLWLPLSNCSSCPSTNKYSPNISYVSTGQPFNIAYVSGSVAGTIATEDVHVLSGGDSVNMSKLKFKLFL